MRLAGLSRKQVTYWAEIGLVEPSLRDPRAASGQPAAFYSRSDALRALIAADLRRRGFTPRQLAQVLRNIEGNGCIESLGRYIVTDGYSIYYAKNDNEVVDILKHRGQMLLVSIVEQAEKLSDVA